MKAAIAAPQNTRIGTCPHGLPMGACPICSGSGGGGGGSVRKADFSAKAGEMSWAECAMIGQRMKNQKLAHQRQEQAFLNHNLQSSISFQQNIMGASQRLSVFAQNMQNSLPSNIAKPLNALINKGLLPLLDVIKDMPLNMQKNIAKIAEKLADISDKLTAMFGELKNSIEKKISDKLKDFKKKVQSFFAIFATLESDDEENKLEEDKRIFLQKTALNTIREFLTKEEEKHYAQN